MMQEHLLRKRKILKQALRLKRISYLVPNSSPMRISILSSLICCLFLLCVDLIAQRPNIIWIVTEDNSVDYLRLYTPEGAPMPNVETLAAHGITYRHAFSNGPVCSVARSTLISSCYAPRIGAQYHRRSQKVTLPDGLEMFPAYLRQAGYYTSNNSKEDYNIIRPDDVWDESSKTASYNNRAEGQPFFHVQNFGTTHEGRLHVSKAFMDTVPTQRSTDSVVPFPYHPNTAISRYTYARYYDLHAQVDRQIGAFLEEVKAAGVMDDTFIFYYGDHGGVLPRSKGYAYESGLHVPLVVYVPEKWKHLVNKPIGATEDAFVSFIDFGPTVLNLAGVDVPNQVDGRPFLGAGVEQSALDARQTAFGYADRFDEKYDHVRSFRKGRYKYIRNYQPFTYDGLHNDYRYKMLLYKEWRELYEAGKLNEVQSQFFQPREPEQLFDLEKDPHELHNLSGDPVFQATLADMRREYGDLIGAVNDLSFFPEPYFLAEGLNNPTGFGMEQKQLLTEIRVIADLQLLPFAEAKDRIRAALTSDQALHRYWGLLVCSSFGQEASSMYGIAKKIAKKDDWNLARARAAEFLALCQVRDPQETMLSCLQAAETAVEVNFLLNIVTLLRDGHGYEIPISKHLFPAEWLEDKSAQFLRRLGYLVSE